MGTKRLLSVATLGLGLFVFASCDKNVEEQARKASEEYCVCMDKYNSITKCDKELNSNYSSYTYNDAFYTEFNRVNRCYIEIRRKSGEKNLKCFEY